MRLIDVDELINDLNIYASKKGIKGHTIATDIIKIVNNRPIIITPEHGKTLKNLQEVDKLWQKVIKEDERRQKAIT